MNETKIFRNELIREEFSKIQDSIRKEEILKSERSCFVVSESEILESIKDLKNSFPSSAKHCFALKSFPISSVLKIYQEAGFGQECASFEEIQIALRANTDPSDIVYDSPCKTVEEIDWCVSNGVFLINADNLDEVERHRRSFQKYPNSKSISGIRINPQIGKGENEETSTATSNCKFGIPLEEVGFEKILEIAKSFPQMKALHVHVGSGGMSCSQLLEGCECILSLANRLNKELEKKQITVLDFGGGFPVPQNFRDEILLFSEFWKDLKNLEGIEDYQIVTEHGRGLFHRAGFGISRVEYVKTSGGYQIATVHLGENIFVFNCISGQKIFPVRPTFLNRDGTEKDLKEEEEEWKSSPHFQKLKGLNIVGPLCFSGDIVCKDEKVVPSLKEEDVVVFGSSGVYTVSHYSKMNSISMCPIFMLKKDGRLECIKKKESFKRVVDFWCDE